MVDSGFTTAARALANAAMPGADLCRPFVGWLGAVGVAISTLGNPLGSETICATDPRTARFDEMQLDLGEGPCWAAVATGRPVLEPDLQHSVDTSWPIARHALRDAGLGAVSAFPLVVAGIDVGAVDLYTAEPRTLTGEQIREGTLLSRIPARQVLRRALLVSGHETEDADGWGGEFSRREVHQATGMVLAQLGISADDALLVLRGHAFATARPLRDVAADVIAALSISPNPPIERTTRS